MYCITPICTSIELCDYLHSLEIAVKATHCVRYRDHTSSPIMELQWRRQRSKGARSFRGQNILQPGHPDALFFQNLFFALKTLSK